MILLWGIGSDEPMARVRAALVTGEKEAAVMFLDQ
jgi:hypothetical protein